MSSPREDGGPADPISHRTQLLDAPVPAHQQSHYEPALIPRLHSEGPRRSSALCHHGFPRPPSNGF